MTALRVAALVHEAVELFAIPSAAQAIEMFGEISGVEQVAVRYVGTRLLSATYLSLGRDFPLRWRFYFYKAEEEWKLIDLRVDDKLTGIFDEAPEENPRPSETRP